MDDALCLDEGDLRNYHRVCSRHFLNADARHIPDITLGKHFASPRKRPLLLQFATSCFLIRRRWSLDAVTLQPLAQNSVA